MPLTPYQTVGPFFHGSLPCPGANGRGIAAGRIVVEGVVRDGQGAPVADALIETWQADAEGRYLHPEDRGAELTPAPRKQPFDGFRRVMSGADGAFAIETVKPGAVRGPAGTQAPHILVGLLGRGLLTRLVTRLYFEGEPANGRDPILQRVPEWRRETLIARRVGAERYRFDLRLQGEGETVFFDV